MYCMYVCHKIMISNVSANLSCKSSCLLTSHRFIWSHSNSSLDYANFLDGDAFFELSREKLLNCFPLQMSLIQNVTLGCCTTSIYLILDSRTFDYITVL
jgi:hypothetical protein